MYPFTWSPYLDPQTTIPKYFDKEFEHNVGESQRGRFGGRKSKYRKPRNHSGGQITQELFLTFLRPGQPRQSPGVGGVEGEGEREVGRGVGGGGLSGRKRRREGGREDLSPSLP